MTFLKTPNSTCFSTMVFTRVSCIIVQQQTNANHQNAKKSHISSLKITWTQKCILACRRLWIILIYIRIPTQVIQLWKGWKTHQGILLLNGIKGIKLLMTVLLIRKHWVTDITQLSKHCTLGNASCVRSITPRLSELITRCPR